MIQNFLFSNLRLSHTGIATSNLNVSMDEISHEWNIAVIEKI